MKNFYLLTLSLFTFFLVGAQTTIFDPDFSDGTYVGVPAVETDLDAHPDWVAGHFTNSNSWVAFQTGGGMDVLRTGAFFTYNIATVPITAVDGDVITIRTVIDYGFSGQSYGSEADENMLFTGLIDRTNPANGGEANPPNRDGVMVVNKALTSQIALTNNNGVGTAFDSSSAILTTETSHLYEVTIEYYIGATAAASTKIAKINSINGSNGESLSTVSVALTDNVYNAMTTGSGAYLFNWALRFGFGTSALSHLHIRRAEVTKNSPVLSIRERDAFEFEMYPNPVKDRLFINTKEAIQKVEAIDLLGRTVLTVEDVSDYIDVSSLRSAMYVVKLTSDNGVSTKRFIKE